MAGECVATSVEVLFIKRSTRVGDKWSGHVAFPGGKREPGDADDRATAARETLEEVGLDLESECFAHLGHLSDFPVTGGGRRITDLRCCPVVWLQLRRTTPPIKMQEAEVAAWRWVPLASLKPAQVTYELITHDIGIPSEVARWLPSALLRMFQGVSFPAIPLHAADDEDSTTSSREVPFALWGLTLSMMSRALVLGGGQSQELVSLPLRLRSPLGNVAVAACCAARAIRHPRMHKLFPSHGLALACLAGFGGLAAFGAVRLCQGHVTARWLR